MIPFSLLDLAPVPEGSSTAAALKNTLDLARHAEAWGYHRYWMAEHHNMPGIASAATAILIGQVAAVTERMRVGSGGIMLPNHSPLVIAEQFGTLAELFPDRIDLGLGRAPGTDGLTARALRRGMGEQDRFAHDVIELMNYCGDGVPESGVRAYPGAGTHVPVWILGSSLYGAQLAAHLGLPYAFASHFAPAALDDALTIYRDTFRPSRQLDKPRAMIAVNVFAADTDAEGQYLSTSLTQAFVNLRSGQPGLLPRPVTRLEDHVDPALLRSMAPSLSVSAIGAPASVRDALDALITRYQPDEVIFTGQIHDHASRLRSFQIAAEVMGDLNRAA